MNNASLNLLALNFYLSFHSALLLILEAFLHDSHHILT